MDLPRINTSATDLCLFKGISTCDLYFKFFDQPGQVLGVLPPSEFPLFFSFGILAEFQPQTGKLFYEIIRSENAPRFFLVCFGLFFLKVQHFLRRKFRHKIDHRLYFFFLHTILSKHIC